jgi:uncharacterized coiled-coil DUF342 family protein
MLPGFVANSTLPQWLIALFSGGTFAAVLGFLIRWRGQTLSSEEQIRKHFADEGRALREKLNRQDEHLIAVEKHLREMVHASDRRADESDRRHEECEAARQELRQELAAMHDEIAGLKRQIAHYSANQLVILQDRHPSDAAPEAAASAERVQKITNGDE